MSKRTFRRRQGKPGTTYTVNDWLVGQVELVADEVSGLIDIHSDAHERAADLLHLAPAPEPRASKAKEAD